MDISLINAGLAAGATLAVVPLILHLLMRQTPKKIIFPALRLIRDRQKQSKKKLRVKNWLLLLARMALFALMALALARPRITTETSVGGDDVDTAVALVFDTSLSMQYTERGKDRLEEAKVRAGEILKKVTDRSEVFVINSAEPIRPASVSPALALKQIDALTLRDANRPLNASVVQAIAAVESSQLPRRDVYVLTDLARSAWDTSSSTVAEAITKANATKDKKVSCYVLKLTPKEIVDVAIVEAKPASEFATQGERLEIKTLVRSRGPKTTRVAELWIDGQPKDKRPVELPENGDREISFLTPNTLGPGLHQGDVHLTGGDDNMSFDDIRYFSYIIQPAYRVLLVSDQAIDSEFVANILEPDPRDLREGEAQLCKVTRLLSSEFSRMSKASLKEFSCVFLLNVKRLTEADWGGLNSYVHDGGGLVVGLGSQVSPDSYNSTVAAQLLPAKIDAIKTEPANTVFAKPDANHSLFHNYAREYEAELSRVPVYKAWSVQPQAGRTILSYNNGSPALLERTFQAGAKTGHVLLWTTPLSRGVIGKGLAVGWNEFPTSWSFIVMIETVSYLAGTSTERLNYEAGEDAVLTIDPTRRSAEYQIQGTKNEEKDIQSVPPNQDKLVVPSPQSKGQWRVTGKAADGSSVVMGFSVNVPEGESTVVALEEKDLSAIFGAKENVHLAGDAVRLNDIVNKVRIGREIFPWLMMLILIIVTLENLLANKFHRETVPA